MDNLHLGSGLHLAFHEASSMSCALNQGAPSSPDRQKSQSIDFRRPSNPFDDAGLESGLRGVQVSAESEAISKEKSSLYRVL